MFLEAKYFLKKHCTCTMTHSNIPLYKCSQAGVCTRAANKQTLPDTHKLGSHTGIAVYDALTKTLSH